MAYVQLVNTGQGQFCPWDYNVNSFCKCLLDEAIVHAKFGSPGIYSKGQERYLKLLPYKSI